ncbi:DUF1841 family protein [Aliifodinibius sp. S!AR15-10]|nr:DUF1841 family protein [Aliifodinibius sp. S!AR15-10]
MHSPDPDEWLAIYESERIDLVLDYHDQAGEEMPNVYLHSTIHAVVENQIALGDGYPVKKTLNRLVQEGLDRHDAIHAIGSVLIKYLWEVGSGENTSEDFSQNYFDEVDQLTAQQWLNEFG